MQQGVPDCLLVILEFMQDAPPMFTAPAAILNHLTDPEFHAVFSWQGQHFLYDPGSDDSL
jgi:hypothetical protein